MALERGICGGTLMMSLTPRNSHGLDRDNSTLGITRSVVHCLLSGKRTAKSVHPGEELMVR